MRAFASPEMPRSTPPSSRRLYEGPRLTRWGDLGELTHGSTGGTSDGNMTGVSETFQFVPTSDWHLDDDC
jgi:hypothetical protein